jgi:hypothetical protein
MEGRMYERMEGTMEGGGGGEGDGRGDGSEIQGSQQALTNTRTVGDGKKNSSSNLCTYENPS